MRGLVRVALAVPAAALIMALTAAPAYADTVEPRDMTMAWSVAIAAIVVALALIGWLVLARLRRRRSRTGDDDQAHKKGPEPPA